VQYFVQLGELGQWAWVRTLNGLDVDRRRGVVSYEAFGSHKWIKVDWILSLIGVLRDGGVNFIVTDVIFSIATQFEFERCLQKGAVGRS
jgi:hypothetical protein